METLFDQTEKPMSTDLVEHKVAPGEMSPEAMMMRFVENGRDPNEMLNVFIKWKADLAADAFGEALAKFQAKCPQIHKGRQINLGGGDGPRYASLDDIMHAITPVLAECNLCVTFSAGMTDGGQLTAKCNVRCGRHVETSEVTLPVPSQMRVNDTQKMGAALSYAKRYALCAALNIVVTDEDVDAAGMVETISEEQIAQLKELIEATNTDPKRFLKWLAVEKLADVPVGQFQTAIYELNRKAGKK